MSSEYARLRVRTMKKPNTYNEAGIEHQYFESAVNYWLNLNTLIWQQILILISFQGSFGVINYNFPRTIIGIFLSFILFILSILLIFHILSNMSIRSKLVYQVNFISQELMGQFLIYSRARKVDKDFLPFLMYPQRRALEVSAIRGHVAAFGVCALITVVNFVTALVFQAPIHVFNDINAYSCYFIAIPIVPSHPC